MALGRLNKFVIYLGLLALPATATASVTITVTSPSPGEVTNLKSTFRYSFTSDDPQRPIDPASFKVVVSGPAENADWRFTVDAQSATYTPTTALTAGMITITASIADAPLDGTTPEVRSTSNQFTLVPSLAAVAPTLQEPGLELAVTAAGLDPIAGRNTLLFTNFTQPAGIGAAFDSVEAEAGTGRITVPQSALSGPVYLEVNGVRSKDSVWLDVAQEIPICGLLRHRLALNDGYLVYYDGYVESWDPRCAPRQRWDRHGPHRVLAKIPTQGPMEIIESSYLDNFSSRDSYKLPSAIARDRDGNGATFTSDYTIFPSQWKVRIKYGDGVEYIITNIRQVLAADFDKAGNLWILDQPYSSTTYRLWVIRELAKIPGGAVSAELMIDSLGTGNFLLRKYAMAASDDGYLYVSATHAKTNTPVTTWDAKVWKVDINQQPTVVAQTTLDQYWIDSLMTSCKDGSVFGIAERNNDGWSDLFELKSIIDENPPDPPQHIFQEPETLFTGDMNSGSFDPDGSVVATSWYSYARVEAVPPQQVSPCSCAGAARSLAPGDEDSCPLPTPFEIVTSTTRWRPQRALQGNPISVRFTAPTDYIDNLVGEPVLTVTIPGVASYVPEAANFVRSPNSDGEYTLQWLGPWTLPGNPHSPLPAANFTVQLTLTVKENSKDTPHTTVPHIVSNVEVARVRFALDDDNAPLLESNPKYDGVPGDPQSRARPEAGLRIFAEATLETPPGQPDRPIYDVVRVLADITPPVNDPDQPVVVYFKSVDVVDPSGASISPQRPDATAFCDNRANGGSNPCAGQFRVAKDGADVYVDSNLALAVPVATDSDSGEPVCPAVTDDPNAVASSGVPVPGCQAMAALRVSRQPGDNYRVASSTDETWLASIVAETALDTNGRPSQIGAVKHTNETLTAGSPVSTLLTVWRTLHVEQASMTPETSAQVTQESLDARGTFFKIGDVPNKNKTAVEFGAIQDKTAPFFSSPNNSDHANPNDWEGATLSLAFHNDLVKGWGTLDLSQRLPAPMRYQVVANEANYVLVALRSNRLLTLGMNQGHLNKAPKDYIVRDDEVSALDAPLSTDLSSTLFEAAYIRVSVEPSEQPLRMRMIPGAPNDLRNVASVFVTGQNPDYVIPAHTATSAGFWSVLLVSAFEGPVDRDWDPITEPRLSVGQCRGLGAGRLKPRCLVFMETLRDLEEFNQFVLAPDAAARTAAHELLHPFGLTHDDAIMCGQSSIYTYQGETGGRITDAHIARIRDTINPFLTPNETTECCVPGGPMCP